MNIGKVSSKNLLDYKALVTYSVFLCILASVGFYLGNKVIARYILLHEQYSRTAQVNDREDTSTQDSEDYSSDDRYAISSVSQEESTWKKYQSYNDGFSIKYPDSWKINTNHHMSLSKDCDYERGQKCPQIELTIRESQEDDLESYFNMSPESSQWPDRVLNTFSTAIAKSDAVGHATLIGNNYCEETVPHGKCPLLTIEYKFFHIFDEKRYVYTLTYHEQTKNQLDISSINDLEFFEDFKRIASTLSLSSASEIILKQESTHTLITFKRLGMNMKIPNTVAIYPSREDVEFYLGIDEIDQNEVLDLTSFTKKATRAQRAIHRTQAQEGILFESGMQCEYVFARRLNFYKNGFNVNLSVSGSENQIFESMPKYFTYIPEGNATCWKNEASQTEFVRALKNGQGNGAAQEWYDNFDTIVDSISFSQ